MASAARSPVVPQLPTLAESGLPGYETLARLGLFAPARTPKAIADKLQVEVAKIIRALIVAQGGDSVGNTRSEFSKVVSSDIARWKRIVRDVHIHVE